jgi:uncharacterized membrane protein YcaP (DUF421 family)
MHGEPIMSGGLGTWMQMIFGGDSPIHPLHPAQVAARAAVVYVVGIALVRLGKSRLLGSATVLDVLIAVVLGSLLSRGINGSASISGTAIACAVLVALHWLMSWLACRSHHFGNLVKGHCVLLVDSGKINHSALRRSHISQDDLLEGLRINANLEDVSRVEKAYKERSGRISGVRRRMRTEVVDVHVEEGLKTVRIELWID